MSESPDSSADRLAELLAAYHDQLIDLEAPRVETHGLSVEELSQFHLLRDCLLHLEHARTAEALAGVNLEARSSNEADGSQPSESHGGRIGRFEILRELGRGGLGIVLLAQDHVLNRRVALKVPRPEVLITPEVRERFNREAQAAARLTHPHIVPVYEVGHAGPISYIVSAYCPGPNLAEWLKENRCPVSPRHAAQLISGLADAIDYAHSHGVLHRDIKPSNILLEPAPAAEAASDDALPFAPKLVDFGLARIADSPGRHTRTGMTIGTLGYMAPEQAEGRTAEIGPGTDVHALGAVLYECLTEQVPYTGNSEADCLRRIVSDDPRRPSDWNKQVPRDLEAICLKCLEKAPARRYASARDLGADLRRFLAGEPTVARPLGAIGRTWRWARRRPAAAALLAVSTVSIMALAIGSMVYNVRLNQALAVSEELRGQADVSDRVAREHVYVADMRIAQQLRDDGDLTSLAGILDRYQRDDRRGFEWRYLSRFRDAVRLTLQAHASDIDGLEFSARGDILATTSVKEGSVRIWQIPSGTPLGSFNVRTSTPRRWQENLSSISPDGRRIATLADLRTMVVFDVETHAELARLSHKQTIHTVAFMADNRCVAVGADDQTLIWEYATGVVTQRYPGARLVATSTDGRQLALAGPNPWSNSLQLFDVPPTAAVREHLQPGPVQSISYSADGTMVAVLSETRPWSDIRVYKSYTSELLYGAGMQPGERYSQIGFSSDGRWLVGKATDGSLRQWHSHTGQPGGTLRGPATRLTQFAFATDQHWLATAIPGGTVLVWDQRLLAPSSELTPDNEVTGPLRISSDGKTLAVATPDRAVLLIDFSSISVRLRLPKHFQKILDLAFAPDGTKLVTTDGEFVYCWNCQDGNQLWATRVAFAKCVDWSPRNNLIAWAGTTRSIGLLSVEHGSNLPTMLVQPDAISGLRFLPDGERLVSVSLDGTIRLWDAAKGKALSEPLNTGAPLYQISISTDGKTIAAASRPGPGKLALWRLNDDNSLEELPINRLWEGFHPSSFDFSPDGQTLALGGASGTLHAIELKTGRDSYTLAGRRVGASSVAYGRDGHDLATVSPEGCLTLWKLDWCQTRTLKGSPLAAVRSLAFSHDGSTLAIATDDSIDSGRPALGESGDEPSVKGLTQHALPTAGAAPAEEVDARPWDSSGPGFRLWDVASEREKPALGRCATPAAIPLVVWSRMGLIAAGSHDGTVWIWNPENGQLVTRFAANPNSQKAVSWQPQAGRPIPHKALKELDGIVAIAFSDDGARLAVATRQGILQIVNTNDWEHRTTICSDAAAISCLAFAPSGSMLVANRGGQLLCWNLAAGRPSDPRDIGSERDSRICSVAFAHRDQSLAIGREDGIVELLDGFFTAVDGTINDAHRYELKGHLDRVTSLCFSSDDRTLASGSWDTTVRLWHTASRQEVGVLNAHHGKVEAVAFSPNGNVLATGGQRDADHGEVLLWHANPSSH
jgi:WD40 repeat protein